MCFRESDRGREQSAVSHNNIYVWGKKALQRSTLCGARVTPPAEKLSFEKWRKLNIFPLGAKKTHPRYHSGEKEAASLNRTTGRVIKKADSVSTTKNPMNAHTTYERVWGVPKCVCRLFLFWKNIEVWYIRIKIGEKMSGIKFFYIIII